MTALTLDASALIAFLAGQPGGPVVAAQFRSPDRTVQISTMNLAEVGYRLLRVGFDQATIDQRIDELVAIGLNIIAPDRAIAMSAGALYTRHHHSVGPAVSLARCLALATCLHTGSELATSDAALMAAARAENVGVVALPDSTGRTPET